MSTLDTDSDNLAMLRESAIERRKAFSLDDENTKATKALGSLASNFLMVRPWCDSNSEGRLEWDAYVYRHEHEYRKTYSGFSTCFLRSLEGLVVKTRPEDVDKDIVLPPMRHRVVFLKPCWFDKMTANLFVQVLRANAVTSERSDVDYLFHKNSVKARHSLIRNLRQSNFTWTGFSPSDVISTLETSQKYLSKEDKACSLEDAELLLESSRVITRLMDSDGWIALSKAHEVGIAVEDWPAGSEEAFSLTYPTKPTMIGITQLVDGQLHVDSALLSPDPTTGLTSVGLAGKAKALAMESTEPHQKVLTSDSDANSSSKDIATPTATIEDDRVQMQPPYVPIKSDVSSQAAIDTASQNSSKQSTGPVSPSRPRKRKLTLADETANLATDSPLRDTRVIGTTSAKLTYLLDKIVRHQATEKIIVFYDGDNAAFYIAQCLEMLYINHRIYARTLDNTKRSNYVRLFNEDPDVRVLLIDVACGALGLNLNVASVVLIVNPINRPNIEAQAIKRAHRIGQTREVLVETLVLENTIEHAIFDRAKNMSRADHQEAKELEDDTGVIDIIQNAQILAIDSDEEEGLASFAPLQTPQQVFGRPNRHKYHRYGVSDAKVTEKPQKKPKISAPPRKDKSKVKKAHKLPSSTRVTSLSLPLVGQSSQISPQAGENTIKGAAVSIFGAS